MKSERLDPLSRLAVRFGSDKFGGHLYTPIYHRILGHLRESPVRILEIGIGGYETPKSGGAGLRMWAEYFQFAKVVGLDIEKKEMSLSPRVQVIQGSQTDLDLLQRVIDEHGPFDIVIDDGSHVVEHVLTTFKFLYPRMPADGIYIVEDVQTSFHPWIGGNTKGEATIFALAHSIALGMHRQEGFDASQDQPESAEFGNITKAVSTYRNMIVFERGDNLYPSNFGLDLNHPQVRAVYTSMEHEAASNPSSRGCLSRIDMAIWGSDMQRAADLAVQAADANPTDVELLFELMRLMVWAGKTEIADAFKAKLARLGESV
jgi:hypothetical protein